MQPRGSTSARKVLLVGTDLHTTDLLHRGLSREGFDVQTSRNGADALRSARIGRPDLAVVEAALPDMDGVEICAELHARWGVPVVMLSARHTDEDVLAGLAAGADDYIGIPFSLPVLVCRLQAILRRYQCSQTRPALPRGTYRVGPAQFSPGTALISLGSCTVKLTQTECKILLMLIAYQSRVLSVDTIMEQLWGYDSETSFSVVKTHMSNLRAKIRALGSPEPLIHSIPGLGYTLQSDQSFVQAPRLAGMREPSLALRREPA